MTDTTPIQDMISVLFRVQNAVKNGERGDFESEINCIWDRARREYDRETLRGEFMPVIRQIWAVAATAAD